MPGRLLRQWPLLRWPLGITTCLALAILGTIAHLSTKVDGCYDPWICMTLSGDGQALEIRDGQVFKWEHGVIRDADDGLLIGPEVTVRDGELTIPIRSPESGLPDMRRFSIHWYGLRLQEASRRKLGLGTRQTIILRSIFSPITWGAQKRPLP